MSAFTAHDPADSPKIVTRLGSPPNAAMFFLHPFAMPRSGPAAHNFLKRDVLTRRSIPVCKESKYTQPVVDGYNDCAFTRQHLAVVRTGSAEASSEAATRESRP